MGVCQCGPVLKETQVFWAKINLRKTTFRDFMKTLDEKRIEWIKQGDDIDLRKCDKLNWLLDSTEFTATERTFYFNKLNEYVKRQSDKLMFFASLSFFTILDGHHSPNFKGAPPTNASALIDNIRGNVVKSNFDIIFDDLLRMAIKKDEHLDVTGTFIELVTEISIDFLNISAAMKEDKKMEFKNLNREELLRRLNLKTKDKLYEYLFNANNISMICNDLAKINMEKIVQVVKK